MTIVRSTLELLFPDVYFELRGFVQAHAYLKLEGFHVTGSIKLKTALFLVDDLEAQGLGRPGAATIVESSSGNLGAALSAVCNVRGYRFICVTDPNISATNLRLIRAYGGEVVIVTELDPNGGYVHTRLKKVQELVESVPGAVWLNQYANLANKRAHAETTAREILAELPRVDWLFVGTGTCGTLMGCIEHFREYSPKTRLVAVEPVGSVTFGAKPARRHISGLGASRRPELLDPTHVHRVVYIDEVTSIRTCREVVRRYGLLPGGSTGTVIAAVAACRESFERDDVIVAISPDSGEKYLDSVYDDDWVSERFGVVKGCGKG